MRDLAPQGFFLPVQPFASVHRFRHEPIQVRVRPSAGEIKRAKPAVISGSAPRALVITTQPAASASRAAMQYVSGTVLG